MKLRPLQDRVLIRRVEPEAKTAGGIFIPDTAQEKPMEGEVVAVGPGTRDEDGKLHPLDVKSRRPRAVRQMVGHRGQARRRRPDDHEGNRHHGRASIAAVAQEESRLTRGYRTWLPRKSDLTATRATACCAASTFSPMRSR